VTLELMTKNVVSFSKKKTGWHRQLAPRVTPTLVTPLHTTFSVSHLSSHRSFPVHFRCVSSHQSY